MVYASQVRIDLNQPRCSVSRPLEPKMLESRPSMHCNCNYSAASDCSFGPLGGTAVRHGTFTALRGVVETGV